MIHFTHPEFLYGLFALFVPIIIHLFNFRRYKSIHFSNVKILQNILLKTKRESQLQHFIILITRTLAISTLVLAFAQPYIPSENNEQTQGRIISIFLDNSYSMDALSQDGSLLQDAVRAAKDIVNAFGFSDDYILITNDFTANEADIMNRDEILSALDEVKISNQSRNENEIEDFRKYVASKAGNKSEINYYISDFQKSQFDLNLFRTDSNVRYFLLPFPSKEANNVSLDSCWFSTPVFAVGQSLTLSVRLSNHGKGEVLQLPVKLHINGQQKALSAVDLQAHSTAEIQLQYNINGTGIQKGEIFIDDAPISFDDKLFFVYEVKEAVDVSVILQNIQQENIYLKALYGKDSLFHYSLMDVNHLDYARIAASQLVVLDQLANVSTGLAAELKNFTEKGGSLLIFPHANLDVNTWNSFLTNLGTDTYSQIIEQEIRVGNINRESRYFKNAVKVSQSMDMPLITKYFSENQQAIIPSEPIMLLENATPMLTAYQLGQGKVFLSAVAMNDYFGEAHKHALFFVALHNIGIMTVIQQALYHFVGEESAVSLMAQARHSEDLFSVRAEQGDYEFIPEQRNTGNQTLLFFHDQISSDGFYDVTKDNQQFTTLAFNTLRKESDLQYYSEKELYQFADQKDKTVEIVNNTKNLTTQIQNILNGQILWRYFLIVALLCFLIEILLLRFWGRAKLNLSKE